MYYWSIREPRDILSFFFYLFGLASATPQHAHYWEVEFQSHNSGYKISRLCLFLLRIMCYFFLTSNDGSGPPLPTSKICPGSLPSSTICLRILSLSSYCLLSVRLSFSLPSTSSSAGYHSLSAHLKSTAFRLPVYQ